ncbi:hypothetical protein MO973_19980 [Paenibacillus sp. TRM 82003]|nr:hypothetical protein [Paenibacillus sp. TRM 82003]
MELTIFSSAEAFVEWSIREPFDVAVVCDELAADLERLKWKSDRVLWISERSGPGPEGSPIVPKYESAPRLVRTWLRHSRAASARDGEKNAPIAAVWSVGGGAGKTKLVSGIAEAWARSGLSPFVVGADPGLYDGADAFPATFHDVSEWLYALKGGQSPTVGERRAGAAPRMHYFLPDSPYREFAELERREAGELLQVAAAADCDIVLVELESPWSAFAAETFHRADALLLVCAADEGCVRKTGKWLEENADRYEAAGMEHKTICAVNKSLPDSFVDRTGFPWLSKAVQLPYVPEWKQDGKRRDALFDRGIERLAEELRKLCVNG